VRSIPLFHRVYASGRRDGATTRVRSRPPVALRGQREFKIALSAREFNPTDRGTRDEHRALSRRRFGFPLGFRRSLVGRTLIPSKIPSVVRLPPPPPPRSKEHCSGRTRATEFIIAARDYPRGGGGLFRLFRSRDLPFPSVSSSFGGRRLKSAGGKVAFSRDPRGPSRPVARSCGRSQDAEDARRSGRRGGRAQ